MDEGWIEEILYCCNVCDLGFVRKFGVEVNGKVVKGINELRCDWCYAAYLPSDFDLEKDKLPSYAEGGAIILPKIDGRH